MHKAQSGGQAIAKALLIVHSKLLRTLLNMLIYGIWRGGSIAGMSRICYSVGQSSTSVLAYRDQYSADVFLVLQETTKGHRMPAALELCLDQLSFTS